MYYAVVITSNYIIRLLSYNSLDELISEIRKIEIGNPSNKIYIFKGELLPVKGNKWKYLITPTETIPLFKLPGPDEEESPDYDHQELQNLLKDQYNNG
ncbi:MAG: hypothetical protein QXV52_08670 [Nitrososphaeria archaeon]